MPKRDIIKLLIKIAIFIRRFIMDYYTLAEELIGLRSSRPRIDYERKLSKAVKGEIFVLNYLKNHDNRAHPKELSDEMLVSTARTAVILNRLEQEGLISRIQDSADNRQIIVRLSDKGLSLLEKHRQEVIKYMEKIFEKLGEDDAREYLRLQHKLISILSEK